MAEFSVFIIGAVAGSFLNMLIYRLPLGISLIDPKRSICPNCKHIIKWYHNIPIISYLVLKGRCSNCNTKIPISYFFVELITAAVTLSLYVKLSFDYNFFISLTIFYLLIVLSFIDFKYKAVPDYLLILLLIATFTVEELHFQDMLIFTGGIVLLEIFITYYIQNIKSRIFKDDSLKEQIALGEGDIPVVASIGAVLGLKVGLIAIFLSALFAIIPSLVNHYIKKDIQTPFIPFLSLGFFISYIFEDNLLNIIGQTLR